MEAAFFDLDKTVIAKASMVAFSRPLLRAGMINRRILIRASWSQLVFQYLGADEERMRKFRESALRITKGWEQEKVKAVVEEALISAIEPIVYDEALQEMREHAAEGRKVFIISASPVEIVEPLGRYLGADESIASRPSIDADGRYTGEVEMYAYGPFKAEAMREIAEREGIDLSASWAYSDSATDLPMLEAVGNPVAVNADRELSKVARERGWEMRTYRTSVPMRERVPMPAPRIFAYVGAGVALAGLATAAWWLLKRHRTSSAAVTSSSPEGMRRGLRRPGASSRRGRRAQRPLPGRSASSYGWTLGALRPSPPQGDEGERRDRPGKRFRLGLGRGISASQKLEDLRLLADLVRRYR